VPYTVYMIEFIVSYKIEKKINKYKLATMLKYYKIKAKWLL